MEEKRRKEKEKKKGELGSIRKLDNRKKERN